MGIVINEESSWSVDDDDAAKEIAATFDAACHERYQLRDKIGQYVVFCTLVFFFFIHTLQTLCHERYQLRDKLGSM